MTDHPDTDLTDPHGEAEALRQEIARLKVNLDRREKLLDSVILERTHYRKRAEAAEAALAAIEYYLGSITPPASIREAGRNGFGAYILYEDGSALIKVNSGAKASPVKIPVPVAASRAPDPAANAGSCQPGDLISRAAAIEAATARYRDNGEGYGIIEAIRALPAAPVAEAQPTIGGAELDALVLRLRRYGGASQKAGTIADYSEELAIKAADAITALRAQPDWKAMAERLGAALRKHREVTPKAMRVLMSQGRDGLFIADDLHKSDDAARAALSDLAKMKGE